jgi:hypothetical protein
MDNGFVDMHILPSACIYLPRPSHSNTLLFLLCSIDYSWFIQKHSLYLVHSHSPVPPVRLELRTAPQEKDHALRTREGLPNVAEEPRDLPTSPGRTQSYGHFQVFYILPFLPFSNPFSSTTLATLTKY